MAMLGRTYRRSTLSRILLSPGVVLVAEILDKILAMVEVEQVGY
jgi:hypothetical protein